MVFDLSVPIVAFTAAAFLVVVMRWVFRPSRPRTGRPAHGPQADLGILVPVRTRAARSDAIRSKNALSSSGVRCSMSRIAADSYDVLVFRDDLNSAEQILAGR
jgi:hypothetical protein